MQTKYSMTNLKATRYGNIKSIGDGYTRLAHAIIEQAVNDLETALIENNIGSLNELKRFFKSSYAASLTDLNLNIIYNEILKKYSY